MEIKEAIELIKEKIEELLKERSTVTVAIDGGAATGKSTLAEHLANAIDANVFHTDDFFLRPCQKTPERLREIGGNMDRERFFDEVILGIKSGKEFYYSPYSCKNQELDTAVFVSPKKVSIIEGAYSHHPFLSENYDLKIFLKAPMKVRAERIKIRSGDKAESFFNIWIPLENAYFESFNPEANADIIIDL
jgi:uridine kinase